VLLFNSVKETERLKHVLVLLQEGKKPGECALPTCGDGEEAQAKFTVNSINSSIVRPPLISLIYPLIPINRAALPASTEDETICIFNKMKKNTIILNLTVQSMIK
jgi:hypothetical protein